MIILRLELMVVIEVVERVRFFIYVEGRGKGSVDGFDMCYKRKSSSE